MNGLLLDWYLLYLVYIIYWTAFVEQGHSSEDLEEAITAIPVRLCKCFQVESDGTVF